MGMSTWPWYVKLALYFGGAAFLWKILGSGLKWIMSKLLVVSIRGAQSLALWALAFPIVRAFLVKNKDHVEPAISALFDGIEAIADAVEHVFNKAIEDAAAADAASIINDPGR